MILKKIPLQVASMLLIACSLEAKKDDTRNTIGTNFPTIGASCSVNSRIADSFPKKYVDFSKKIPAELWVELEFYDCQIIGTYFFDEINYRYRINSSGAGIFWVPNNENIDKIFFNCDKACRTKIGWPIAIDSG